MSQLASMAQCEATRSSTDEVLQKLFDRYEKTNKPLMVNFRKLVDWLPSGEWATHFIHPYPAKLLAHIPHFFLANRLLSKPGDSVLDPFCGSGTVLLESVLAGRNALGADANPLARLISSAKVTRVPVSSLYNAMESIMRLSSTKTNSTLPRVVNLGYWFLEHTVEQLSQLLNCIKTLEDPDVKRFFLVCFSNCVRKVSLADPRLSVPVRLRSDQYPPGHWLRESTNERMARLQQQNAIDIFREVAVSNIERMERFCSLCKTRANGKIVSYDARGLGHQVPNNSVPLVITSPPYLGAQKYIRASSLSLGWLGLTEGVTLRQLEDMNIGREHYPTKLIKNEQKTGIPIADKQIALIRSENPLRATITENYLLEMRDAMKELIRVLKPGGHLVLVAANNQVCGREFKTQAFLREIAEQQGLVTRLRLMDDIKSRGLMTRRNKTAGVIAREWVLLFQKPVTLC